MACPTCGHDDDPEQGIGSLMLGAGSDWPASTGPYPTEEEMVKWNKIARGMAYRAGQQLVEIILEALKEDV